MPTWRLRLLDRVGTLHHLDLEAEATSPTAELIVGLEQLGFEPVTVDGRSLAAGATIGELGLRHGSLLEETPGPAPDDTHHERELLVLTGPSAGQTIGLRPDTALIDTAFIETVRSLLAPDPGEGGCTVLVEGEPWGGPTQLSAGMVVTIGTATSTTAFTVAERAPRPRREAGPGPTESFVPRFREARTPLPARLVPPVAPAAPDLRHPGWWRSLLPLATGVGFALLTGRWEFLVLSALAPLVYTVEGRGRSKSVV